MDVGCGNGAFVRHMKKLGWDVSATEIDPGVVTRLQAEGIDAQLSSDCDFGHAFDVVTSWHVFEHVPRPLELAQWCRTQLKLGGIVQFTVPNVSCLQSRLLGRQWMHLDVPRHRHHFSPETFVDLLNRAGFTVLNRTNLAIEYDWFGVIQSAAEYGLPPTERAVRRVGKSSAEAGGKKHRSRTRVLSVAAAPPLAVASLPAVLLAALGGDGATLTLTGKPVA